MAFSVIWGLIMPLAWLCAVELFTRVLAKLKHVPVSDDVIHDACAPCACVCKSQGAQVDGSTARRYSQQHYASMDHDDNARTGGAEPDTMSMDSMMACAPRIAIAYASYSQNCFMLAQKLFSALNATLHTSRAAAATAAEAGKEDDSILPRIDVLELSQNQGGFTLEKLLGDTEEEADNNEDEINQMQELNSDKMTNTRQDKSTYALVIFLVSTFTDGAAPPRSQTFEQLLRDAYEDHRVARNALSRTRFALFGLGDMAYGPDHFNAFAKHVHLWCRGLGAPAFVVPPVYATESRSVSLFNIFLTALLRWVQHVEFAADGTLRVCRRNCRAVQNGVHNRGSNSGKKIAQNGSLHCGNNLGKDENEQGGCINDAARISASSTRKKNKTAATRNGASRQYVDVQDDTLCLPNSNSAACTNSILSKADTYTTSRINHDCIEDNNNNDDHTSHGSGNSSNEDESSCSCNASEQDEELEDVEDVVWDGAHEDSTWVADMTSGAVDHHTLPELLYPKLEQSLTKQGYRLLGSHSAVKLCRWTKSMLRGRGGCYKHTFYNINSSQCMEMTPSLACANKCVFCWRHHTNPVSRAFRWRQDSPEFLIARAMVEHRAMIKQMRGVPGVTPARLADAMQIRHCALSLVGEPIMYPQINRFCNLLHEHHISSFMVTNAQFPDQLRDLQPVVQLYLSIDAPTPEELKKIDRPLFEDYWERCVACVQELRRKRQRTVFRLTLVNQYNNENIAAYADLVQMGWPDFIEVKGVTYCGTSATSTLTMKEHVPRHTEVIQFCHDLCAHMAQRNASFKVAKSEQTTAKNSSGASPGTVSQVSTGSGADSGVYVGRDNNIHSHEANARYNDNEQGAAHKHAYIDGYEEEEENKRGGSSAGDATLLRCDASAEQQLSWPYRIACEHEHSCCVLIALDKFYINGRWHTWIDYEKFFELVHSDSQDFTSLDYALATPAWATYNSQERGFDPNHTRMQGKKPRPE